MTPLIYKGDKPFKRIARTHQSDFRTNYLKVPFDPKNKYGKYGAFLMPDDAKAGLNFCEDFRQEILKRIKGVIQVSLPHNMMVCMPTCCAVNIYLGMCLFPWDTT